MNEKIQNLWEAFPGCAVVLSVSGAMLVETTGQKLVQTPPPKVPSGTAERDFESPDEALDALRSDVVRMIEERARLDEQRRVVLGGGK